MKSLISSLALCAVLTVSGAAQAALIDRGGGLLYDDVLNVTWLQDANFAKTSGYDADGRMNWHQATSWAADLSYYDSVRHQTLTDWRLPATNPVNGTADKYTGFHSTYDGSTDMGYGISEQGTVYAGSTGSEMAYLFYNSLNNTNFCDPARSAYAGVCQQSTNDWSVNTGPFTNLQFGSYWSSSRKPWAYAAWIFYFNYGAQNVDDVLNFQYSLAVRDGDVSAVPVPAAAWLLGSGLLGLIGVARRKAA